MNRLSARIAFVLFLLMFAAAPSLRAATLTGTVFDENNQRMEHAAVELCDGGGTRMAEEVTTDSGEFTFRGLVRGSYMLRVTASGYQPQELPIDLNFTSDRGLTIYLKPANSETRPAAKAAATVSAHEMSMPQAARELVESGKHKFWIEKDHDGGMKDLERAVTIAPGYYEAYYEIGMAYMVLGKANEAAQSFRKSVETSGEKYGDGFVGLGSALLNEGKVDEGKRAIERGVELNPKSFLGLYELAKIQLNEKRVADAAKSAEQARSIAPNFASIYRVLANIHLQQKNYPAMLEDIDAYVKLDPDSPAGVRAKQMREEVVKKIGAEGAGPVASKQ